MPLLSLADLPEPVVVPGGFNGRNTVKFNDNQLIGDYIVQSTDGGFTLFAVVRADCTSAYHSLIDHHTWGPRARLGVDSNCRFALSNNLRSPSTANRWQVVVGVWGFNGAAKLYTSLGDVLRVHSESERSDWWAYNRFDSGQPLLTPVDFDLFSYQNGQRFHGDVAELMLFAREVRCAFFASTLSM